MDLLELRASSAPLAFACPGSVRPAAVPVRDLSTPARLGTATHEVLRGLVETGSINWNGMMDVAASHNVSREDVAMLAAMARNIWIELAPSFPDALAEVPLSAEWTYPNGKGIALSGHADILSISGTAARVGDWKTGRIDSNHAHQMRAYAALALLENPELTEATSTVIWIRDGEIENYTMRRPDLPRWTGEVVERVLEWNGIFHPGGHCVFCPRSHECEAATALARRDVAAMSDRNLVARAETELALMPPQEIIELHRKAETVRRLAERVDEAIKAHVIANGEVVGEGVKLTAETSKRRELDPISAWPLLRELGFKDVDFADCMDLRISRVEKRVAEKAGRGNGAAAVRSLTEKLEAAEAVTVRETHYLKERRT